MRGVYASRRIFVTIEIPFEDFGLIKKLQEWSRDDCPVITINLGDDLEVELTQAFLHSYDVSGPKMGSNDKTEIIIGGVIE